MNKTRKNKNNKYNNIQKYITNLYSKNLNNVIIDDVENNIKLNEEINNTIFNNIKNTENFIRIQADKYIFTRAEDEDMSNFIYKFIAKNSKEPCLVIFVPKDNSFVADIEKLSYNKGCSYSENELEEKNGTIIMLKTALSYIIDKYPHIRTFKLTDMTHKNDKTNKLWITPRRLLLGNKGWYEEYFGAISTAETKKLIEIIKKNRNILDKMLQKNNFSWWTTKNILETTVIIDSNILTHNILRTTWIIYKHTIEKFYIPYELLDENTQVEINNINNKSNGFNLFNKNNNDIVYNINKEK